MEKRLLLAFALSMAVLLGYSLLFPPAKPVVQENPDITAPSAGQVSDAAATDAGLAAPEAVRPTAAIPSVQTTGMPERELTVDTDLVSAVLSTKGGVIKSWRLKQYLDDEGKPIEMAYSAGTVRPLLVVPDGMTPDEAAVMDYAVEGGNISLEGGDPGILTLTYIDAEGRMVEKTLTFKNGTYEFGLDVKTQGIPGYELLMGESFGSMTGRDNKGYGHVGFMSLVDGTLEKNDSEKLEGPLSYKGKAGWTAVTDKYFIGAVVPADGLDAALYKGSSDWGYVGVREAGGESFDVYAGPKDYGILKAAGHDLQLSVDFGWFSFIAKPVFVALKFFHGLVGNWGWAIIIITIIVKLIFAPLTHKQQKSMKRMQKLQPKINELKEKHKGDSQKMNMEMMELYKREKVNPLGGCLPMLIQIPVFIALYNVLNNAIELRRSPFMWWLTDLSAKDPYYILPILMGASMFAMQKMTPTTADPMQNKIMMVLPVVFTFMFISLPSGLVLYFTVSNLLSMAQQLYINRSAEA